MTLGQRSSQYRKQLGISQEMLGERLGVSRQAVSKWETDAATPDMENLLALAREFGVSVAELTQTPEEQEQPSDAPVSKAPLPSRRFGSVFWPTVCATLAVLLVGTLALTAWLNRPQTDPNEEPVDSIPPEIWDTFGTEEPAPSDTEQTVPVLTPKTDFSQRFEPEQEIHSDTLKVYHAWNQLVTNNNLSAEEQYAYRRDVFGLLPTMDWGEFRSIGSTEQPDDTLFALMWWLANQDAYSPSEILWIQMGCTAKGLDGAYSESYSGILSSAFFHDPIAFAKALATDGIDGTTKWHATLSAAFDAARHEVDCVQAIDTLEIALSNSTFTDAQADWCRLLLLYLATPEDEMATLPRSPADMQ